MNKTGIVRVFRGTFAHSTQHSALEILEDALLGVDSEGKVCPRILLLNNVINKNSRNRTNLYWNFNTDRFH